jgi:hypothetical protein
VQGHGRAGQQHDIEREEGDQAHFAIVRQCFGTQICDRRRELSTGLL